MNNYIFVEYSEMAIPHKERNCANTKSIKKYLKLIRKTSAICNIILSRNNTILSL